MIRKVAIAGLMLCLAVLAFGQANRGELRLKITDPSGLGVRTSVRIVSEANEYRTTLNTDDEGTLIAQRLPYGIYNIEIRQPGFAPVLESIDIRSPVPAGCKLQLKVYSGGRGGQRQCPGHAGESRASGQCEPDRCGSNSESRHFGVRTLHAGPGERPAGMVV